MGNSRKKVIVRTLDHALIAGYAPLNGLSQGGEDGALSLLDLSARLVAVPLDSIRWIAYVRDFNLADAHDPERLSRRTFLARPRSEGLWLRLTLQGGDVLEGLAALDLSLFDAVLADRGIFLVPPDIRSNTQRIFVPRGAMLDLQVVAVITNPSKPKQGKTHAGRTSDHLQKTLFADPPAG